MFAYFNLPQSLDGAVAVSALKEAKGWDPPQSWRRQVAQVRSAVGKQHARAHASAQAGGCTQLCGGNVGSELAGWDLLKQALQAGTGTWAQISVSYPRRPQALRRGRVGVGGRIPEERRSCAGVHGLRWRGRCAPLTLLRAHPAGSVE